MQLKNLIKAPPLRPERARIQPSAADARTGKPSALLCSVLLNCRCWFCRTALRRLRPAPPARLLRQARHATAAAAEGQGGMEVEMQLDDDVYFAELSRRISLLITDDDEADFGAAAAQFPAVHLPPGFSMSPHVPQQGASMLAPPAYTLFHHAASYGATNAGDAGRAWQQQQQQCGSKGTGVFIPRSTPGSAHSKRKGRNWSGSKAQKARAQAEGVLAAGTPVKRRP